MIRTVRLTMMLLGLMFSAAFFGTLAYSAFPLVQARGGFWFVEMLAASAICLFVFYILISHELEDPEKHMLFKKLLYFGGLIAAGIVGLFLAMGAMYCVYWVICLAIFPGGAECLR